MYAVRTESMIIPFEGFPELLYAGRTQQQPIGQHLFTAATALGSFRSNHQKLKKKLFSYISLVKKG
jgi:hypothetical protein